MTAFESITLQQYRRFPLTITTSSKSKHQTKPRSGTYARLSSNDTPKAHQKLHIWNSSEANQPVASLQTRNQSPLTSSKGDQPLPPVSSQILRISVAFSFTVRSHLFRSFLGYFSKSANFGRDCKNSDQTFPLHFSVHSSFSATHIFLHSLTMPLCSIFTPLQSLCALWQLHALEPPDVRSAVCCKQGSGERTGTSL